MSILKTSLIAASFVVAATAANAQVGTNIHGEPASGVRSYSASPYYDASPRAAYNQDFRGAFAREWTVAPRVQVQPQWQQQDANPLFDDFHGND